MIQSRVVATTVLILIALTIPAIAQDDLTDAQYAELSRALDMPVEEIRAMNLSPDDLQVEAAGRVSPPDPTASSAMARWPRAPGGGGTSPPMPTSNSTTSTTDGGSAARCASSTSATSAQRSTGNSPPATPSCGPA